MKAVRWLICCTSIVLLASTVAYAQASPQAQKAAFAKLWTSEIPESLVAKRPIECALITDCNGDGIDDLVLWAKVTGHGKSGRRTRGVFAFDGVTGKCLWTNQEIELLELFDCGVIGHWMYFSDDQDTVHFIDLSTGKIRQDATLFPRISRWEKKPGVLFLYGKAHRGGVEIYAFRASLTEFAPFKAYYVWLPDAIGSPPSVVELNDGSPAAFTDNYAFLLTREGLASVDRSNGNYVWKNAGTGLMRISACVSDGNKLVVYDADNLAIEAFSARNGEPLWKFKTGVSMDQGSAYDSPPCLGEKCCAVYLGSYKGVGVLDMQTGQVAWRINTGESPVILSPLRAGSSFLVRTTRGVACYALDTAQSSQQALWQSSLKNPLVVMGKEKALLVGRKEDTIEAISLKDGASLWKKKVPLARGLLFPFNLPSDVELTTDQRYVVVSDRKEIRVLSSENGETIEALNKEALKTVWADGCGTGTFSVDKDVISWRPFGEEQPQATGRLDSAITDDLFAGNNSLFVRTGRSIVAYAHPHPGISDETKDGKDLIRDYMEERLNFIEYFSTVPR